LRSTLFFIPHQWGPWTVFGWGWALLLLIVSGAIWAWFRRRADGHWNKVKEGLPALAMGVGLVLLVVPRLESQVSLANGSVQTVGIPVRGYGVFLLAGVIAGFLLANHRAHRIGLSPDDLLSLGFWGILAGIAGARLFYVVQYWNELEGSTTWERVLATLKFTEGGLVVYGSAMGGLLAVLIWCRLRKRSFLSIADLIAPGFMLGLAFGRIGCFLNGCCFGGLCHGPFPCVAFPSGSPVYVHQIQNGQLLGIELGKGVTTGEFVIEAVRPESWGERNSVRPGQTWQGAQPVTLPLAPEQDPAGPVAMEAEVMIDHKVTRAAPLPPRSLPVHPAQLYSSLNALAIAIILYQYWPRAAGAGRVLGLGLCLYAMVRIFEEWIRVDESGKFGTSLTISTWISLIGLTVGTYLLLRRTD
jgi:phosphatidylglycerol:prolipoprotein diacylglycerol transferase